MVLGTYNVERVRDMYKKDAVDFRNYERMEDWSPTDEDLQRNFRSLWAEEHTLVWAAHQLERWSRRLTTERGEEPSPPDTVLAGVRNALEHLDEADFAGDHAIPGPVGNRSLRALPGGRLHIQLGGNRSFGLIEPQELEARALATVQAIERELEQEAIDWYLDLTQD